MTYRVLLRRSAERDLDALPRRTFERVMEAVLALRDVPRPQGAKKLTQREGWRVRVGDYRVLYAVDDAAREVHVAAVRHRKDAYRNW